MNIKNKIIYLAISVFLYFFFVFDVNFHGPDEPVYFGYTASLVEDGDLNIVNQVYFGYGKFVSETYNFPNLNNYGGVVLWLPFYTYAKSIYYIANKLNIKSLIDEGYIRTAKCAMSFSTVIFGFLGIIFTYLFCRKFFSKKISTWSVIAIFLGTPFFYYTLFEVGNPNVISCLLLVISIWFCSDMMYMGRLQWFLYGLFFSVCTAVRTELLAQLLFIFSFFIILCALKKISWKNGLYFLCAFIPILVLNGINLYLKLGQGWFSQFLPWPTRLRHAIWFDGFLNSFRGIFYTSPILYVCFLGFLLIMIKTLMDIKDILGNITGNLKNFFFIILSLYLILKLLFLNVAFSPGGDTLSGRMFLSEFPIFVLLFAHAIQKKYLRLPILILSPFLVFWNLLISSEFMTGLDWIYIEKTPSIIERVSVLKYVAYALFYVKDSVLKLKICLPLIMTIAGALLLFRVLLRIWNIDAKNQNKYIHFKLFYLFVIYLVGMFTVITALNMLNNKRNVEKMKADGFFKDIKIIKPSPDRPIDEEEEIAYRWFKHAAYCALKGDINTLKQIKKAREKDFGRKVRSRLDAFPTRFSYYGLANFFKTTNRYKKAIQCYHDILKTDPNDFEAYISLGDIYNIIGEYEKALVFFNQALSFQPKLAKLYITVGNIYYSKLGRLDLAIDSFQKAILSDPTLYEAYQNLGDIYSDKGEYDKAIGYYQKAIEVNPTFFDVYLSLGGLYARIENHPKAIEYLQRALQIRPNSLDVYVILSDIYNKNGDYPKAIEYLNKAVQLKPNNADAYSNLGNIYSTQGNYPKAIEHLNKAIQLKPNNADAYSNLGNIYSAQGNYPKAIEDLQKSLDFNPNNAEVQLSLGNIYLKRGDTKNASKQVENLKKLGRNNLAEELEKAIGK
ncbi:MAG: tetratricopeptide repeat protein [Candidatus Omnitrophota bacterium]|nr:tetratricopeptide repeat protein [Candidatus Omnitrophota bacterium]